MSILTYVLIAEILHAQDSVRLKQSQIESYEECFKAFRNYSQTESLTVQIDANRTLLLLPAGDRGIYVYPSDGIAFKSPITSLSWEHGVRVQLYFYTSGSQTRYEENRIEYAYGSDKQGKFTDKNRYRQPVDHKRIRALDTVMNTGPLKKIDRGQSEETLFTSLTELPLQKRNGARVSEQPLLDEINRLANKMDEVIVNSYPTRNFDRAFEKACSGVSDKGKEVLAKLKMKLSQKPPLAPVDLGTSSEQRQEI